MDTQDDSVFYNAGTAVPDLRFPDLEEVPAVKPTEKKATAPAPAKRQPGVARTRFSRIAFTVLAKIIDEKMSGVLEEEETEKMVGEATNDKVAENDGDPLKNAPPSEAAANNSPSCEATNSKNAPCEAAAKNAPSCEATATTKNASCEAVAQNAPLHAADAKKSASLDLGSKNATSPDAAASNNATSPDAAASKNAASPDAAFLKNATSSTPRRPRGGVGDGGGGSLSRHGSTSSLATVDSFRDGICPKRKPRKGPSFFSVIRLANYRRRLNSRSQLGQKRSSSITSSSTDLADDDEDILELPDQPRFCATLSTEAQYSMLKCYEDVLIESLQNRKMKEAEPEDATLFRVKTPHDDSLCSLHLASPRIETLPWLQLPQLSEDVTDGAGPSPAIDSPNIIASSESSRLRNNSQSVHAGNNGVCLPSIETALQPGSSWNNSIVNRKPQPAVPLDKQLRLSYRFQTAMDILDAMRNSKGELVTSTRSAKLIGINPLNNYNRWSKGWSKEFQFKYNNSKGIGP